MINGKLEIMKIMTNKDTTKAQVRKFIEGIYLAPYKVEVCRRSHDKERVEIYRLIIKPYIYITLDSDKKHLSFTCYDNNNEIIIRVFNNDRLFNEMYNGIRWLYNMKILEEEFI